MMKRRMFLLVILGSAKCIYPAAVGVKKNTALESTSAVSCWEYAQAGSQQRQALEQHDPKLVSTYGCAMLVGDIRGYHLPPSFVTVMPQYTKELLSSSLCLSTCADFFSSKPLDSQVELVKKIKEIGGPELLSEIFDYCDDETEYTQEDPVVRKQDFINACKISNVERVISMLKRNPKFPELTDSDRESPMVDYQMVDDVIMTLAERKESSLIEEIITENDNPHIYSVAIQSACSRGLYSIIRGILERKGNIIDQQQAPHWFLLASEGHQLPIMELLVERYSNLLNTQFNAETLNTTYGRKALVGACWTDGLSVAQWLYDKKQDIFDAPLVRDNRQVPVDEYCLTVSCCAKGDYIDMVRWLLDTRPHLLKSVPDVSDEAKDLIEKNKALGKLCLNYACTRGNVAILKCILDRCPDLLSAEADGKDQNKISFGEVLLRRCTDRSLNYSGQALLEYLDPALMHKQRTPQERLPKQRTPQERLPIESMFVGACCIGNLSFMNRLLRLDPLLLDRVHEDEVFLLSALEDACLSGALISVRFLLERKPDFFEQEKVINGKRISVAQRCLEHALMGKREPVVRWLLQIKPHLLDGIKVNHDVKELVRAIFSYSLSEDYADSWNQLSAWNKQWEELWLQYYDKYESELDNIPKQLLTVARKRLNDHKYQDLWRHLNIPQDVGNIILAYSYFKKHTGVK